MIYVYGVCDPELPRNAIVQLAVFQTWRKRQKSLSISQLHEGITTFMEKMTDMTSVLEQVRSLEITLTLTGVLYLVLGLGWGSRIRHSQHSLAIFPAGCLAQYLG